MTVSRMTLPQEFFDRTSNMMLRQPEPQYLYAQLVFMANAQAELKKAQAAGAIGLPFADRQPSSQGAPAIGLDEMQLMLSDSIRGEAIHVNLELGEGKGPGHTLRFNRPVFTNSTYTEASRTIAAGSTISTTAIDLTAEQVSVTLKRVAGPYDQTNSRIAPYAIDRFDSMVSVHSIAEIVGTQLQRDRAKYVDSVFATYYSAGANTIYPGDPSNALTTDASAMSVNGDRPMDVETLWRAEQVLGTNSIPRFGNGTYVAVLSPQQARQLKTDKVYREQTPFDSGLNPLRNSFVGKIGNVEVYQSSTKLTDTTSVASVTIHQGTMFGPKALCYCPGAPCIVKSAADDNYGETSKVIWVAIEGHAKIDQRFICAIHTN